MTSMTRRQFIGTAAAGAAVLLAGCGSREARNAAAVKKDGSVVVFASSSLESSLTSVTDVFTEKNDVKANYVFDSSEELAARIAAGEECDVFVCGKQEQMNRLDAEDATGANVDGLDFIDTSTREDIVKNDVVLAVPAGNPMAVLGFDDFAARLAAGQLTACVADADDGAAGHCADQVLEHYGISASTLASSGFISYAESSEKVAAQVASAAVGCGIVCRTDANAFGLEPVDAATDELCDQIVYTAAMLKETQKSAAAKAYLDFLAGDDARYWFLTAGFTSLTL